MGDDITKFGPMRVFVRPFESNEPWHEVKGACVRLSTTIREVLLSQYHNNINRKCNRYHIRGKARREMIRAMQSMGLLKKPKTTYRTNNEYFKKRRK